MPLFALTIYWHLSLKGRANRGHKSTEITFFDSSLLKEKSYLKIITERLKVRANQWHERPAIFKSNFKSISFFVKHPPVQIATDSKMHVNEIVTLPKRQMNSDR